MNILERLPGNSTHIDWSTFWVASIALATWFAFLYVFALLAPSVNFLPLYVDGFLTLALGWGTTLALLYYWAKSLPAGITGGLLAGLTLLAFQSFWVPGWKDFLGILVVFGGGMVLSESFREPGHLVPLLFIAGVCDMLSLSLPESPTSQIKRKAPYLLTWFSLQYPMLGTTRWVPILGFTDWLITATAVRIGYRDNLPVNKIFKGITGGLILLLFATLLASPKVALPALPFLALGVTWALWKDLQSYEGFKKALGIGVILLLVGLIGIITYRIIF